jgi:membrane-associated phospholipid phosphatase
MASIASTAVATGSVAESAPFDTLSQPSQRDTSARPNGAPATTSPAYDTLPPLPVTWRSYYRDPLTVIDRWTWTHTAVALGAGTAIVLLSMPHDEFRYWVRSEYQEYNPDARGTTGSRNLLDRWGYVGFLDYFVMEPIFAVPVALYGVGWIAGSSKLRDASFTSVEAALWANLAGKCIKFSVGRVRPQDDNPTGHDRGDNFYPFTREPHDSFPSGHTTIAFALIVPWMVYYPNPLTFSLLGFGVATGISRLANDSHWSTDVLGGALLGSSIGYAFASNHLRQRVQLRPLDLQGAPGAELAVKF